MSQIIVLGDTNSGKTVYLTMLSQAFTTADWALAADEDTSELLAEWRSEMLSGRFPPPTSVDDTIEYSQRLILNFSKQDTTITIRVPHVAGIMAADPNGIGKTFFDVQVDRASGVLILVDANSDQRSHAAYSRFFQAVCSRLSRVVHERSQARLEWKRMGGDRPQSGMPAMRFRPGGPCLYLAICFTKCDALKITDPKAFLAEFPTETRLEKIVGASAYRSIAELRDQKHLVGSGLFACSAVGFQTVAVAGPYPKRFYKTSDGRHCLSQVCKEADKHCIVDGVNIFPEGVEAPMAWLLDSIYGPKKKVLWDWFPRAVE